MRQAVGKPKNGTGSETALKRIPEHLKKPVTAVDSVTINPDSARAVLGSELLKLDQAEIDMWEAKNDLNITPLDYEPGTEYSIANLTSKRITIGHNAFEDRALFVPGFGSRNVSGSTLLEKKDSTYLRDKNFKVYKDNVEIDPMTVELAELHSDKIPYRIIQVPGAGNALGKIKFMFNNPFGIYLHDTPNRPPFNQSNRAVSHGCVRVEKPLLLAEFLLSNHPKWNIDYLKIEYRTESG